MRGEKEHNEGVPLSILAVLPFHHLLREKEREKEKGGEEEKSKGEEAAKQEERIDGEELPAVTL